MNIHNYVQGVHSQKEFHNLTLLLKNFILRFLHSYVLPTATCFILGFLLEWLQEDFMKYFNKLEDSVNKQESFTKTEKATMMLSQSTLEGPCT